jgi:hypothetical protein
LSAFRNARFADQTVYGSLVSLSPRTLRGGPGSPPSPTHKHYNDSLNLGVTAMSISPSSTPATHPISHHALSPNSAAGGPAAAIPASTHTQLGHTHVVLGGKPMPLNARTVSSSQPSTSTPRNGSPIPMDTDGPSAGNSGKASAKMSLHLELPANTMAAAGGNPVTIIPGRQNPIYYTMQVSQLSASKATNITHASTCIVLVVDCSVASNSNTMNVCEPAVSQFQAVKSSGGLPQLSISNCSNAAIYLLGPFSCANISHCVDCEIVVGAIAGGLILSNCERIQSKRNFQLFKTGLY